VLCVIDDALALAAQEPNGLLDHPQVLLGIDTSHLLQVQRPRLPHERAHGRERVGQESQGRIGVRAYVAPPGHPEGRDVRTLEAFAREQFEERLLLGVRAGEPGLDQMHPELVKRVGDAQLLVDGQRHALALHAVAESGVVEIYLHRTSFQRFESVTERPAVRPS
jgi:hypothetical protein